jgi:hypothetical protein
VFLHQQVLNRIGHLTVSPIGTQVSATFGNWSIISMEMVAVPAERLDWWGRSAKSYQPAWHSLRSFEG